MENRDKRKSHCLLMLITTPKSADKAADMFQKGALPIQYRFHAQGTASSEIMDMLGLGSIEKRILVSVMPTEFADIMLNKLRTELRMDTVNSGIAFTIPLNGANHFMINMLERAMDGNQIPFEREGEEIMEEMKYMLIAAYVNRGFSSEVMDAARKAGAGGGTVINGRRLGTEKMAGFWGISVQEEKEVVFILSENEKKTAIMQAIGKSCGMHSDARGIVMSIPIDSVIGFQSGGL